MPDDAPRVSLASALLLTEVFGFLRRSRALGLAVFLGVAYALGSLLSGGMLVLVPQHVATTIEIVLGGTAGSWNYPAVLVVAPWGILALPLFATAAMVGVAVGVGLGMAVAVVLVYRVLKPTPEQAARVKSVGIATGLNPAMIGLVTIGSCCTTTAAATGGMGLIAQASGTTSANLLLNNWYFGVAQLAIVWVALLGQELLLTVYGGLLGLGTTGRVAQRVVAPPFDRRWAAGAALRAALAVGGILWSLSMFAEWTTQPPLSSGAGWWVRWVLEHQLVAAVAVGAAFFPVPALRLFRALRRGAGRALGVVVALAAGAVLLWLPAPLPAWGLDSLTDQVIGALGAPASWGAIAVGPVTGAALVLRWAIEFVVPAGFTLVALASPERAFAPLTATVARLGPPAPFASWTVPAAPGTGPAPSASVVGAAPTPAADSP